MKGFISSFFALITLFIFGQNKTTITVLVPNASDEVFIAGNQEGLGNWQPDKIKLIKVSDYERELVVDLGFPAEFKFTRGSWQSEATIVNSSGGNIVLNDNSLQRPYVIKHWSDRKTEDTYSVNYIFEKLDSKILNAKRTYKVFLPKNYSEEKTYPVFYITDASWSNFEIALNYISLMAESIAMPEVILVGVIQEDRGAELDVFWSETGIQFKNYLFQELIPHINESYATSGFNAIIGHSDGAEYNHLLMLEKDNPFRGFVNISTNLNKDVTREISDFFKTYDKGDLYYFIASGAYDSEDRLKAGKQIEMLYQKNENGSINFRHQLYKADHNNLVAKSMLDGISFIFRDYRNLEPYNDFKNYSENYVKDIETRYGFKPELDFNDIDFYFGKILDEKDLEAYEYLIKYTSEQDVFKSNLLDRANHYYYMEQYPNAVEYWNKTIDEFSGIEPRVFYYNFEKAIKANLYIKKPKDAIEFLEKSKLLLPQYTLEFDYFIAKTALENKIELRKARKSLKYCKANFKDNIYFSKQDLVVLDEM